MRFEPKKDEIIGSWRNMSNVELHNFWLFTKYIYDDQFNEVEMGRACNPHEKRNA
jgi:hypothetical protein